MYYQARGEPSTPKMVGRLSRAIATEMGVQTRLLDASQREEVFHNAPRPNLDHGKLIEGAASDQFQKNLRDFKAKWSREERQEKFTPKRYKRHVVAKVTDPSEATKSEEVKS